SDLRGAGARAWHRCSFDTIRCLFAISLGILVVPGSRGKRLEKATIGATLTELCYQALLGTRIYCLITTLENRIFMPPRAPMSIGRTPRAPMSIGRTILALLIAISVAMLPVAGSAASPVKSPDMTSMSASGDMSAGDDMSD